MAPQDICPKCQNRGAYCADPGIDFTGVRARFERCDCRIGQLVGKTTRTAQAVEPQSREAA